MPDYSKGKIYKIFNIDEPEKFYVGSTTMKLWHRLGGHKSLCKKSNRFFYQEVKKLCWDKFKIELIENFPCNNRQELFAQEEKVRSQTNAYYNMCRAFVSEEQRKSVRAEYAKKYQKGHKKEIAKYKAQYDKIHREQIAQRKARYQQTHKEQIAQRKARYRQNHKEQIAEYQAEYRKKR